MDMAKPSDAKACQTQNKIRSIASINMCVCCLAENTTFVPLSNCKHKHYLKQHFKNKINFKKSVVCFLCHNTLRKIDKFIQEAMDSILQLSKMPLDRYKYGFQSLAKSVTNTLYLGPSNFVAVEDALPTLIQLEIKADPEDDNELLQSSNSDDFKYEELENDPLPIMTECLIKNKNIVKTIPIKNQTLKNVTGRKFDEYVPPSDGDLKTEHTTKNVFPKRNKKIKKSKSLFTEKINIDVKDDEDSVDEIVKSVDPGCKNRHVTKNKKNSSKADSDTETENELLDFVKNPEDLWKHVQVPSDKYKGRIKIITLTNSEFLAERESLKRDKSYLSKDYRCQYCLKSFLLDCKFANHMKKHKMKPGHLMCEICQIPFNTESTLKLHYRRHFLRYVCTICGKRSRCQYSSASHYNSAHGDQHGVLAFDFTCNDCGYVTDCYRSLSYHRQKHKNIECKICFKSFASWNGYQAHMTNLHNVSKKTALQSYKCKECEKSYAKRSSLASHVWAKHRLSGIRTEDQVFSCGDCRTTYQSKHSFKAHLKNHPRHAVKSFMCNDCDKSFFTKAEIKRHICSQHMPIHKCDICLKSYATPRCLKVHIWSVHEKRQLPRDKICHFCGKGFTSTEILKTHIRTHTRERPLACDQCPATFAHKAARYNHRRLVHHPHRKRPLRATVQRD